MYKKLLFLIFIFCNSSLLAQNEFITTWEVTDSDLVITIPTDAANYTYDYSVEFGDGTILNNQTGNTTHTYSTAGVYTVKISGDFPKFNGFLLQFPGDNTNLMSVEQWGNIQWESMEKAFWDCIHLQINATDAPDLSNVSSLSEMFSGAENVNQPIDHWDVSNVTDMSSMFNGANSFNQPLNNWDVSNVTNMWLMFSNADAFNQPLDSWDVSNVTTMDGMFLGADVFNQLIGGWDVSSVTDMEGMFRNAVAFNQPLDNWDVSNVTTMESMFTGADNFNQSLNNWDVSNVTTMQEMFWEAIAFNQPLDNWDVSSVIDMRWMFSDAIVFNQSLNNWDVSSVADMAAMFEDTEAFNQPLNNWDVSNVNTMSNMFRDAVAFNLPLDNWDVSSVVDMSEMFEQTTSFNQPLNSWDVSGVGNMRRMFKESNFNQPLNNWDVSNVTTIFNMFQDATAFNQDLSNWDFNVTNFEQFIANTAMDTNNYDLLLDRFVQLGIENGSIDSDGLAYCDIFTREQLIQDQNWIILNDELGNDCNVNYVSGTVKFDDNDDGCDNNDQGIDQFIVNVGNGTNNNSGVTDQDGNFTIPVLQDTYTVSVLNLPNYLNVSPSTQTVSFSGINQIEDNIDFCITSTQSIEDLSIDLFPIDRARPGFETEYELIVENNGTQDVSNVQITVGFEEAKQSFASASQAPSGTTSNSIIFTLSSLPILSSEIINFTLLNAPPPSLTSGDVVFITADVVPDAVNTNDSSVGFAQNVVNSFDPNDKLVIQVDEISVDKTDEYLDYKVRFQNVGTANALNVKITDTISDKLDWTTFQPINSSHDYRLEIIDQEEINFIFDNINLPYESLDEEGSNGHVSFRIKPQPDVQIGDVIDNKAYIFFDFNAPIITNTVSTEIIENLSITEFTESETIKLLPNPASNQVEIIHDPNINISKVEIYDLRGRLFENYKNTGLLNISQLNNGIYLIKVQTQHQTLTQKLIIDN